MSEITRRQVLQLYQEVDCAVAAAGPVCIASGRCCRFKEFGHVLYLSNLEAEVLLEDAPWYDRPSIAPDFCPFQVGNLCTARNARPLACRIYYCDPNYQQISMQLTETLLHQLKEIAQAHGIPWKYAPLHHFLSQPEDARTKPLRAE
jgi:hypothetical protein